MRKWFAPENEQNQPGNKKNSKDISVVTPPKYDTALTVAELTLSRSKGCMHIV